MDERMRLYTAENGELKHGGSPGKTDRRIQKDRESRLLLQYDPGGVVRYFFYARKKGRPEQYIAEYGVSGIENLRSDRQKRDRFLSEYFPRRLSEALDVLEFELDESHWESKTLSLLKNGQQISKPKISDEAKMALNAGNSAELSVPDMESALWILFNKIPASKSVVISEGGYLDHRGEDDFLIQVDRMKNEVEPIKASKEKIDKSILRKKKKESKKILKSLNNKAVSRSSGASELSDALVNAGVTDRLGIDIYSKSEKSVIRSRFAALSFLAVVPILTVLVYLEIIEIEGFSEPIILGESLLTVLGPIGPYVIRSYWVLFLVAMLLLYYVISRASLIGSILQMVLASIRGNTTTGGTTQNKASRLVDTLAKVRRRGSTRDVRNLLREGTPSDLVVDGGSRSSFRRKNILVGVGIGAALTSITVVTVVLITMFFKYAWSTLMQIALVLILIFFVTEVLRIVMSLGNSKGRRGGGF